VDTVILMFDSFEEIKKEAKESANTSTHQDRLRQLLLTWYNQFEALKEAKTKRDWLSGLFSSVLNTWNLVEF